MAGPALVVLIMVARCTSATTIRERWKNKDLLLTDSGKYNSYLRPHGRSWEEGEKENLGFCNDGHVEIEFICFLIFLLFLF